MRDRFDEQTLALFPLETRPDTGGADAYVVTHAGETAQWIGTVAGIAREDAEKWAGMFRRPHAATLRQAHANARALLAPAQTAEATGDAGDPPPRWACVSCSRAANREVAHAGMECPNHEEPPQSFVDALRARRKPAPTSDERPMLTELTGDDAKRLGWDWCAVFADDAEDVAIGVQSTGTWFIYPRGDNPALQCGSGGVEMAREAAAKWYRLPAPSPVPGDAAPAFNPCGKPACGACTDTGGTMGELAADIQANHAAEIGPDALRERAIRAVAARLDDEAGPCPFFVSAAKKKVQFPTAGTGVDQKRAARLKEG